MNKKTKKFIKELEQYLNNSLLRENVYFVLNNAIVMLRDGRFKNIDARKYICDWIDKIKINDSKLNEDDLKLYVFVKPKDSNGVLRSLAYSISSSFR